MTEIIHLCSKTRWTLEEANKLIPLLDKITAIYWNRAEKLNADFRFFEKTGAKKEKLDGITRKIENLATEWAHKLSKLGVTVFADGRGSIGFDMGNGYYSWIYGEKNISHYHDYTEGPHQRRAFGIIGRDAQGT